MAFTSVMVLILAAVTNERQQAEAEVHNLVTVLEQRVAERTAQFEESNQQLSREIVERQHAEELLREREERFRRIFEEGPVGIAVVGLDGRITEVNTKLCQMLGYMDQELRSQSIADLTHPEDVPADLQLAQQLFAGEIHSYSLEKRYLTKAGQVVLGCLTGTLVRDEQGQPLYAIGIVEDITERKQAESQLRQAKEELENRVERRTAELRVRARQQEAVAELGRRALTEDDVDTVLNGAVSLTATVLDVDSSFVLEWLPDTDEAMIRSAVGWGQELVPSKIPAGLNSFTDYAIRSAAPVIVDDINLETRFDISPLIREQGVVSLAFVTIQVGTRPYGTLGVGHRTQRAFRQDDVNFLQSIANILAAAIGQKHIHEVMQQAKEEAERANHAKSEFLSRMSHELRTPLNAILGFGQILEVQPLTARQKQSVDYILRGGRHLLGLINEVLDIARVETGGAEQSLEPLSLDDIVPEVCSLVQPLTAERSIRLNHDLSTLRHTRILADRQRLKQVLINLLSNAIKYNHPQGDITVSCDVMPDGRIGIAVSDTGPGIAAEDLPKLFTPFERLDAANSGVEGTGLGLVLSQRLVTAMGGTLNVQSTLGQGSIFTIELPQATGNERAAWQESPATIGNTPRRKDS